MEIISRLWPILVVQLIVDVAAIFDLVKQRKTRNLTPMIWAAIIIFFNILGALLYFTVGRNEE